MTPMESPMTEPDNLTLVLVGSLADNDPWDLELWARDDVNAGDSNANWYRAGTGETGTVQRVSWTWLEDHAQERRDKLTVLGSGAP